MRKPYSLAKPFWAMAIIMLGLIGVQQWSATTEFEVDNAILAMGMDPQSKLIREIASENGWTVECEGNSGRMTVLRLTPGILPWRASEEEIWSELSSVATSFSTAARIADTTSCDVPANEFEVKWNDPDSKVILAVGSTEVLEPLIAIAQACGVEGVRLTDGPPAQQEIYSGELPNDWVGLEVDPRINPETGPFSCLILLSSRELNSDDNAK